MNAPDGKITKAVLKIASGEFDIESIHTLILCDSGITDLGCLRDCLGLERLDLSNNEISSLHKLSGLNALKFLNLSVNKISSLDGLQSLENLQYLNLAGNLIDSLDSLSRLCGLQHLQELRLKDESRDLSNPACMSSSYTTDIIHMLPALQILDGQRIRGKGSEAFHLCQELDKALNRSNLAAELDQVQAINVPLVNKCRQSSESWHFPGEKLCSTHSKAEEHLKDLLISCQHLSAKAAERLQELHLSRPSTENSKS